MVTTIELFVLMKFVLGSVAPFKRQVGVTSDLFEIETGNSTVKMSRLEFPEAWVDGTTRQFPAATQVF